MHNVFVKSFTMNFSGRELCSSAVGLRYYSDVGSSNDQVHILCPDGERLVEPAGGWIVDGRTYVVVENFNSQQLAKGLGRTVVSLYSVISASYKLDSNIVHVQ